MRVNSGLDLSLVAVRISESGNGYIKKIKNHITLDTIAARNSRSQIFIIFWKATTLTFISGGNPDYLIM